MSIIPCLFTLGSQFGNHVIFGFMVFHPEKTEVHAVRSIPRPIRQINDPPPKPVLDTFDLLLAGTECEAYLASVGALGPLFASMAEDMAAAVQTSVVLRFSLN